MKNIIYILLFACGTLLAQTGNIKGKVTFNENPEEMVNVYIKGTSLGTTTDDKGNFNIKNIPVGKHKIIASFVGFKTQSKRITIIGNKTTSVDFSLQEDNSLDEIVISGTLKPVKKLESPVPVEVYSLTFLLKTLLRQYLNRWQM